MCNDMVKTREISEREIKHRREQALVKRQRKRRLEGNFYKKLWGRELPTTYPEIAQENIKRILLLQRNQRIGDIVVAMAVTGGLRKAFPKAYIATMVPKELGGLAIVDKAVSEVIPQHKGTGLLQFLSDLRTIKKEKWDVVAVLGIQVQSLLLAKLSGAKWQLGYSYNHRGDSLNRALVPHHSCHHSGWEYEKDGVPHIVDFWIEMFQRGGIPIESKSWEFVKLIENPTFVPPCNSKGEKIKIGFHPFSGNPMRNWMLGRWAILGKELVKQYQAELVITGGHHDQQEAEWLSKAIGENCASIAGTISIIQTWSALRALNLVISVDTAIIHMAAAVGIPVVSLFGPGDPAIWGPRGQLHRVIQNFPLCHRCKGGKCVQPRVYCMETITVDLVLEQVRKILPR
jgi:ADP-heptose:LPS heptosyltransferase